MEPYIYLPEEGVGIYIAPIVGDGDRVTRRESEKAAAVSLATSLFGHGTVISHSPDGVPVLRLPDGAPAPSVSISHSLRTIAMATGPSDKNIGVDIELPRPQLVRVARRFLSPEETGIHAADMEKLLRAWTAKEAAFKAARIAGLTLADILLDNTASRATIPAHPGHDIRIVHFPGPEESHIALAIAPHIPVKT